MAGKVQTGASRKLKSIDLTKEMRILRTRSDFDKFITTQRDGATSDTLEDINSLIDFVVHSKPSNTNRTKPINDNVKRKIQVPPTVLYKDKTIKHSPFTIPPRYIRYIQTRVTVPGLKLSDNTMIHYNLYKEDQAFIDNFNSRCSDLQLSTNDFLIIMDILEKASAQCHASSPFSYELGLLVARENGISVPAYILREVHAHWVRRRNEFGLPLIRHLWPQTCPTDTSPLALFRPRAKDKMLLRRSRRTQTENLLYLYHLIDGFKRVLKILSKMRQRDEKKLILAELDIVLFDQRRNELIDPTYTCPFWNCILDIKKSRLIKKKRTSSIDDSGGNKIKFDFVERNVLWDSGHDLPEAESYKKMRLSRRMGRGGRVWIDRFHLGDRPSNDAPPLEMDVDDPLNGDVGHQESVRGTPRRVVSAASGAVEAIVNGFGDAAAGMGINGGKISAASPAPSTASRLRESSVKRESTDSSSPEPAEQGSQLDSARPPSEAAAPAFTDEIFSDGVWINRHLDEALGISSYNNFDIYNNDMPLDTRPPFANPYEAGHFYNTIGFSMFSIPGYIKRQLQILNLLDNITVHQSTES